VVSHIEGAIEADGIYGNIIFDLHPHSQKRNQSVRKGLPIYYNYLILNFMSLLSLVRVLKFNSPGIADIL